MGTLMDFASKRQRAFDAATSPAQRKAQGHFGTPGNVAGYMAGMLEIQPNRPLRVLDPGGGVGTLSAAVCDAALAAGERWVLHIETWETDPALHPHLLSTLSHCQAELARRGHEMTFELVADDFILGRQAGGLFDLAPRAGFDAVVMNPPYFKVRKDAPHARMMAHVIHGQPNIYALFMAHAAELLADGGELVAITPRSYFNGPYFKKFRKWFFDRMTVRRIHTFESRADVFLQDAVLQENVILKATKGVSAGEVVLSASTGADFGSPAECVLPYPAVVEDSSGDHVIRVSADLDEHALIEAVDRLPGRFRDSPFRVSTGPVVTFRSSDFLRDEPDRDTAPLLWMHNVRAFRTQFPAKNGKPTHILVNDSSRRLLLPAKRYVLLKRFTAKEEPRRLVAGIFTADDSYSPYVGLENHLNYVYKPGGELTPDEAYGLAGYFNSSVIDRYFRAVSGNTQVNATEIRALPVPDLDAIRGIGEQLRRTDTHPGDDLDTVVGRAIGLPAGLVERLAGVSR